MNYSTFMRHQNLRKVSKIVEYISILVLVCGIILSLWMGISKNEHRLLSYDSKYIINWGIIIGGIVGSFVQAVLILFISRLGNTIADLRDHFCPEALEAEEKEEDNEI